jgi:hypothetical protein
VIGRGTILTEFHHPRTFQSRGVAAPFTTPLLAGTRVRASERSGIELVVPNPSGGRGVYVLQGPGVRALCSPTMHDTILIERLSRLPLIDPARMRDAALDIAREGYAGVDAAAAAEIAWEADRSQFRLARFLLLVGLIGQVEPTERMPAWRTERTPMFERRAKRVLHRIAQSLGQPSDRIADVLAEVAGAFAPVGVPHHDLTARIPRLIARLEAARADLSQWLTADPANDVGGLGRIAAATMEVVRDGSAAVLDDARAALADPAALLGRWMADPARTLEMATRGDWMLDGWEQVCLLWLTAGSTAVRRAALLEMAQVLPVMPLEVTGWIVGPIPREALDPGWRVITQTDGWRRGVAALALIQRNETLRALRM